MNNKTLITGIIAIAVFTLTSCDKLTSLADIKFSVTYNEQENVPGLPDNPFIPSTGLTTSIPTIGVETKSQEYIQEYNTSEELIREVKISLLSLNIDEPSSQNFDIVDSLWLYVSGPGVEERLAAYKFDIPKNQQKLEMTLEDLNLKEYFVKDSMFFRLKGHFYGAPDSATKITFNSKFDVIANPLEKDK